LVVWSVVGFVAIAWAVSYAWGSVLARPLIERHGAGTLSGATMVIGGGALLAGSLGWEPNSTQSLEAFWGWPAALGWLFLLVFGSLIGYSLFMQLLRDLGPAKAGSFAFVSPIIAVLVGVIAAGETVSPLSIAGMAVMLVAAGACLYSDVLEGFFARITRGGAFVQHSDEMSWRRRPWLSAHRPPVFKRPEFGP
jgi:drug/metabolite transporter (DMT)-like permease